MSNGALAIVTGGNRGLGLETCRQLARRGFRVWLTSRDARAGQAAAAELAGEGLSVEARVLDVGSGDSVLAFAAGIGDAPVDVLVNNAGISLKGFDADRASTTLAVNTWGAAAVTDALIPHLAHGARVVMVSSGMGELSSFSPPLRERFLDPAMDRVALRTLLDEFLVAVRDGTHAEAGWPTNAYSVSKAGMNALVRIYAPAMERAGVKINAVCPGWVRTDLGGSRAPRSVEQGASGIVWAATLPADGPSGGFFRDGRPISW